MLLNESIIIVITLRGCREGERVASAALSHWDLRDVLGSSSVFACQRESRIRSFSREGRTL